MRAEVERAYQAGGLAAATAEEEETAAPGLTVDQIIERTTGSGPQPSITSMIIQNKEQAMDRLRSGRENITARRDEARQREDQDRWLAFGQAMLTPSRTGGLGENIGMAAGAIREESARSAAAEAAYSEDLDNLAAQEIAAESNAIDQLLTQAGHANGAKGIHGAIQTMVHQDDRGKPVAEQRIVFGSMQLDPVDGQWKMQMVLDEDGRAFEAADRMDPARAAALITATERAAAMEGRGQEMIDEAYGYRNPLNNIRRANDILENAETIIETSGFQGLKNRVANWLGVDFGDTVDLTELQMRMSEHYLSRLEALKGNTSDRDIQEMKSISIGIGQNTTANYRQLRLMENIYSNAIRRGIREAYQSDDHDAVADLWKSVGLYEFDPTAPFIETKTEYDKLKPGARYYVKGVKADWGGPYRTKPVEEEGGEE